jgi:hypothetical protein
MMNWHSRPVMCVLGSKAMKVLEELGALVDYCLPRDCPYVACDVVKSDVWFCEVGEGNNPPIGGARAQGSVGPSDSCVNCSTIGHLARSGENFSLE